MSLLAIPTIQVAQIEKQIPTFGHSPYIVIAEDSCQYVMKLAQNKKDVHSIAKEFICGQMLKLWEIPTPDMIGLAVPLDIRNSSVILNDKRLYHTDVYFGSKFIQNCVEVRESDILKKRKEFESFRNLDIILDLAFFDIWIENDDRKPTNCNLLYSWNEKLIDIVAIDHAFTFGSLTFDQLNPDFHSFSDNDSILYSNLGKSFLRRKKIDRDWAINQKKLFLEKINLIKENFRHICNNIPNGISLQVSEVELLEKHLFSNDRINDAYTSFIRVVKDCKKSNK